MLVFLVVFLGTMGLIVTAFLKLDGDKRRALARLRDLSVPAGAAGERGGVLEMALSALPRVGSLILPVEEKQRLDLQARLRLAGFYNPLALRLFLGVKLSLVVVLPVVMGLVPYLAGLISGQIALLVGSAG